MSEYKAKSKSDLEDKAKKYLSEDKLAGEVYVTSDGCMFKDTYAADYHARTNRFGKKMSVHRFERVDDTVRVQAGKTTKLTAEALEKKVAAAENADELRAIWAEAPALNKRVLCDRLEARAKELGVELNEIKQGY